MYEATVVVTITTMLFSTTDYIRRAWLKETHPVLASWILFMVVMTVSFATYWTTPDKSWTGNIAVTAGVISTASILFGVIVANLRHGTLTVAFDPVQKRCLFGGFVVVVFWVFTDDALAAYILIQVVALVGYIPMVKRLAKAKRSTEPMMMWINGLIVNVLALYPAWVTKDMFSWIYLGRGIPCVMLVIYLSHKANKRSNQNNKTSAGPH